ncbi:MAG: TIGR04282 family arsenosugar biosynthesis glycosyltransferase [Polaribacter sp.]|nr:TIGR04282 family arsenosugar biosynthesis glycosyltransferase [Polaribacter sp.]
MKNNEERKGVPKKTNELLFVFVRNPELGKVKTRLATAVGDKTALTIYKFLLEHTKKTTQHLPCDKAVYYSVNIRERDIWHKNTYQKHLQKGADLGSRMQQAFINSFADGYEKVVIIGSDLPDLEEQHILEAFQQLNTNDVVLGPAKDGGYYLLGMKKLHPNIFQNKKWGTASVRKETLKDLKKVTVHLLEELNDVDVRKDIENHPSFEQFLI